MALATADCLRRRAAVVRVVARLDAEAAEIDDLVPQFLEQCFDPFLEREAGVVRAEGDAHERGFCHGPLGVGAGILLQELCRLFPAGGGSARRDEEERALAVPKTRELQHAPTG